MFSYDTKANAWEELPPMTVVRRRTGAAACCHAPPDTARVAAPAPVEITPAAYENSEIQANGWSEGDDMTRMPSDDLIETCVAEEELEGRKRSARPLIEWISRLLNFLGCQTCCPSRYKEDKFE
jgi:hypothetical protein